MAKSSKNSRNALPNSKSFPTKTQGTARRKIDSIANSIAGSVPGGELQPSEILRPPLPAAFQPEINTDISQFLNTKHTFEHILTEVTHTAEGDKREREFMDRESSKMINEGAGGFRYLKGTHSGNSINYQHHGFRSVTGMTRHTNGTLLPLMNPGTVIFNHNHYSPHGSNDDPSLLKRHTYGRDKN